MPTSLKTIIDNARFLVTEVQDQVKLTCGLLNDYNPDLLEKIASKDDYADNLKSTVEDLCFFRIHGGGSVDTKEINDIRSLHIICVNLERIADYCVNIARQTHYLSDCAFIHDYDYQPMFTEIQTALSRISSVFASRNLSGALDICKAEFTLDGRYKAAFDRIMDEMRESGRIEDRITVLFIFRYLERIGDAILNIGEALLFAIIGDRIKIRHFEALQKTLSESGFEGSLSDIDFNAIWGSRSGCRIGRVDDKRSSNFKAQGIFKEGAKKKIKQERENIKRWDETFPGLAPRVFGYYEKLDTASLLVEFLTGCTLDQVVLTETQEIVHNVIFLLEQTLSDIWETTRQRTSFRTDYMDQLRSRMAAIRRVHPHFHRPFRQIEGLAIPGTDELIQICADMEGTLTAPMAIFIHGDFNVNNIVYDHAAQQIHYIDLYRSRDADYVQDASVFLASNFRLPIFEPHIRVRIDEMITHFWDHFRSFARRHGDTTFEARMALAMARSFYTSTRFELNYRFARDMFLRAHFLLERLADHREAPPETFRFPAEILFH
jgi:phosphate uptake regulator